MTDIAAELAALRADVDRLKSREAIRQQLARYGRGQEWRDESLMHEVFWADAAIDFGFFKGVWADYAPILMNIQRQGDGGFHLTACAQIAFDTDDRAQVECYGVAGGQNGEVTQVYGGRYLHVFERREGVWKSASCTYVLDWTLKTTEAAKEGAALGGINRITGRSPDHPLFRRLGLAETA
jgi:hypothetical protein